MGLHKQVPSVVGGQKRASSQAEAVDSSQKGTKIPVSCWRTRRPTRALLTVVGSYDSLGESGQYHY